MIDTGFDFSPGVLVPESAYKNDLVFAFNSGKLLVKVINENISIPERSDIEASGVEVIRRQYLGILNGINCYSAELSSSTLEHGDFAFRDLRSLMGAISDDMFMLVGRAFQIAEWDRNHQYCGRCGSLTETKAEERAKVCPSCGLLNYPRISPAIIVAVIKDDKILLAHNNNFRPGHYSIIAGFVDVGETFEECVKREVKEEVNITVKDIRYFGSQPWPFPHSMMVGFIAHYESGEIKADGVEIGDADWYSVDNMPQSVASKTSIAGKLIQWFKDNNQSKTV